MRKILLITYAFPPVGGIMVQRILSLAKYLPAQGFEVHVLTPRNPATPVFDHELLKQVPAEVVVHRSFTPEPPFYLRKKIWDRISPPSKGEQKAAASNGSVSLKSRISNAREDGSLLQMYKCSGHRSPYAAPVPSFANTISTQYW